MARTNRTFMDKQDRIVWNGYCKMERSAGLLEIEATVNKYGYIIDFKFFSDLTMSLAIEVEEQKVDALFASLRSYLDLEDCTYTPAKPGTERLVFLHITFAKGTGDLANVIPSVPG